MSDKKYRVTPYEIVDQSTIDSGTPIVYLTNPKEGTPELFQGHIFKNGSNMRVAAIVQDVHGGWMADGKTTPAGFKVAKLSLPSTRLNFEDAVEQLSDPLITDPALLERIRQDLMNSRQSSSNTCNIL